jgi:hypothetical protein
MGEKETNFNTREERNTMRSTKDLVDELHDSAPKASQVCIVVGFEKNCEMVWSTDPEPLQKLNRLVEAGGIPLGLIAMKMDEPGHMSFFYDVYEEHRVNESGLVAEHTMKTLLHIISDQLVKGII